MESAPSTPHPRELATPVTARRSTLLFVAQLEAGLGALGNAKGLPLETPFRAFLDAPVPLGDQWLPRNCP